MTSDWPVPTFYNTLTRHADPLQTWEPGVVTLYVCGPTVYDRAHLGHARCYITWDVLVRTLRFWGYTVNYARNITDVDDKILNRARDLGLPFGELAEANTQGFHADMAALNTLPPDIEPRATAFVSDMIRLITLLLEKEMAYEAADGSVYFRTEHYPEYGALSRKPLDELVAGARVEVDPDKESPCDFALWKGVADDDPDAWDAPWGRGRPGWHIECSTMIHAVLGEQIDLHAGGADLVFPHHENEIAQSVTAFNLQTPEHFVRQWLHNGFVNVHGEKMSKSLGNFATVRDLLTQYDANTLRAFLLQHHYRMPVDFTDEALTAAQRWVRRAGRTLRQGLETLGLPLTDLTEVATAWADLPEAVRQDAALADWQAAMLDDMNTPRALAAVNQALKRWSQAPTAELAQALGLMLGTLGFDRATLLSPPEEPVAALPDTVVDALARLVSHHAVSIEADATPEQRVDALLTFRAEAKQRKDWGTADALRQAMTALGFQLMDHRDAPTSWTWQPVAATAEPV